MTLDGNLENNAGFSHTVLLSKERTRFQEDK